MVDWGIGAPVESISAGSGWEPGMSPHYQKQQQQQQQQQQQRRPGPTAEQLKQYEMQIRQQLQQQRQASLQAAQFPARAVTVDWIAKQTTRWREALRAQVEHHMLRVEQEELAKRRAEEEQRQKQIHAAQLWQHEQQQIRHAQLQRMRQEHAARQRKLEIVREHHRKQFAQIQEKLNIQAREVQRAIEARTPTQKFAKRKRGVAAVMKAYSGHIGVKRQCAAVEESEQTAPWSDKEVQLLHQLAASATSRDWSAIAARLPGRTAERCCERWAESFAPSLKLVAKPQQSSADHRDEGAIVDDDEAVVNECRKIVGDLALRWRDAISFMTLADARKVDAMWQVYEIEDADGVVPKQKSDSELGLQSTTDDEEAEARSIMRAQRTGEAGFKEGAGPEEAQEDQEAPMGAAPEEALEDREAKGAPPEEQEAPKGAAPEEVQEEPEAPKGAAHEEAQEEGKGEVN